MTRVEPLADQEPVEAANEPEIHSESFTHDNSPVVPEPTSPIHPISLSKKINLEKPEEVKGEDNEEKKEGENAFECNICFDHPNQPVITSCGHLYCWPCIYRVSERGALRILEKV